MSMTEMRRVIDVLRAANPDRRFAVNFTASNNPELLAIDVPGGWEMIAATAASPEGSRLVYCRKSSLEAAAKWVEVA